MNDQLQTIEAEKIPGNQITIDGKVYDYETLTPNQKGIVAHIGDLQQKMQMAQFQATQCQVAQKAFIDMFKADIAVEEARAADAKRAAQ